MSAVPYILLPSTSAPLPIVSVLPSNVCVLCPPSAKNPCGADDCKFNDLDIPCDLSRNHAFYGGCTKIAITGLFGTTKSIKALFDKYHDLNQNCISLLWLEQNDDPEGEKEIETMQRLTSLDPDGNLTPKFFLRWTIQHGQETQELTQKVNALISYPKNEGSRLYNIINILKRQLCQRGNKMHIVYMENGGVSLDEYRKSLHGDYVQTFAATIEYAFDSLIHHYQSIIMLAEPESTGFAHMDIHANNIVCDMNYNDGSTLKLRLIDFGHAVHTMSRLVFRGWDDLTQDYKRLRFHDPIEYKIMLCILATYKQFNFWIESNDHKRKKNSLLQTLIQARVVPNDGVIFENLYARILKILQKIVHLPALAGCQNGFLLITGKESPESYEIKDTDPELQSMFLEAFQFYMYPQFNLSNETWLEEDKFDELDNSSFGTYENFLAWKYRQYQHMWDLYSMHLAGIQSCSIVLGLKIDSDEIKTQLEQFRIRYQASIQERFGENAGIDSSQIESSSPSHDSGLHGLEMYDGDDVSLQSGKYSQNGYKDDFGEGEMVVAKAGEQEFRFSLSKQEAHLNDNPISHFLNPEPFEENLGNEGIVPPRDHHTEQQPDEDLGSWDPFERIPENHT